MISWLERLESAVRWVKQVPSVGVGVGVGASSVLWTLRQGQEREQLGKRVAREDCGVSEGFL